MRPALFLLTTMIGAASAAARQNAHVDRVHHCSADESGALSGGVATLPVTPRDPDAITPAAATTLFGNPGPEGASANRFDLVFVGDGYLASELNDYANHVSTISTGYFAVEPYATYLNYFAVHRVDVISNESGVDNAPTQGVQKDTALDMTYWCSGIERLLCVDTSKAWAHAANAPAADHVIAIANNSKYGGAGYTSQDVATGSAKNVWRVELALHEAGHSFANLADEYWTNGTTYNGNEFGQRNSSILDDVAMAAAGTKWANWLGTSDSNFDGLHGGFQGSSYNQFGAYRSTNNSKMRTLGRPFNLPSVEAILIKLYQYVQPIEDASPSNALYDDDAQLYVTPMQPIGHALDVQWFLDDVPIPGATGTTLDVACLGLAPGFYAVEVEVTDPTPWVRDAAARAQWMTQRLTFAVQSDGTGGFASYCDAAPNSTGSGALIGWGGSSSIAANDLTLTVAGAPASIPGLFLIGTQATAVPFGDGTLCLASPFKRLIPTGTDGAGSVQAGVDLTTLGAQLIPQPGDERRFQFWYRDLAAGGAGFNMTDGLRVTFCP